MNFEELIKKLKTEYGKNGCFAVLESNYCDFKKTNNDDDYYWLNGFIWGLCATNFISWSNKEDLEDILLKIDDMKGESL